MASPFKLGEGTGSIGGILPVATSRRNAGAKTKALMGVVVDTIAVIPGTIAAGVVGAISKTITGVAVGDLLEFNPPTNLDAGLAYAGSIVTAPNTVSVLIANITASPITATSKNWTYTWMDLT